MKHRELASMRRADYLPQSTVLPTVISIRCHQNLEIRDEDEICVLLRLDRDHFFAMFRTSLIQKYFCYIIV